MTRTIPSSPKLPKRALLDNTDYRLLGRPLPPSFCSLAAELWISSRLRSEKNNAGLWTLHGQTRFRNGGWQAARQPSSTVNPTRLWGRSRLRLFKTSDGQVLTGIWLQCNFSHEIFLSSNSMQLFGGQNSRPKAVIWASNKTVSFYFSGFHSGGMQPCNSLFASTPSNLPIIELKPPNISDQHSAPRHTERDKQNSPGQTSEPHRIFQAQRPARCCAIKTGVQNALSFLSFTYHQLIPQTKGT